jgi:hypothetical protein
VTQIWPRARRRTPFYAVDVDIRTHSAPPETPSPDDARRPRQFGTRAEAAAVVAVALAALALRWWYTLRYNQHRELGFDAAYYELLARVLRQGQGFVNPWAFLLQGNRRPTALFPPGFPVLLTALSYLGLAGTHTKNLLVGATLGGINVVLVWHVARRFAGRGVAFIAMLLAAADPLLVGADGSLMAESLGLLLTLLLVELLLSVGGGTATQWLPVGFVASALILVRGEGVVIVIALVAVAAWTFRVGWRRALFGSAIVAFVVAAALFPWLTRNQRAFGTFVFANNTSTVLGGANCHDTYHGERLGFWLHPCLNTARPLAEFLSETEFNDMVREEGVTYAREHPGRLSVVAPVRVLRTWAAFHPFEQARWEAAEGRLVGWVQASVWYLWALVPLALAGLPRLVRKKGAPVLLVLPIVVTVTSALTYGNQRFRVTAEPAVLILAACGIASVAHWLRGGRRRDYEHAPSA